MSQSICGITVVAPSTVTVGETFALGIKMLCEPYFTEWTCKYYDHLSVRGPFNRSPRGITYMDNAPPEWSGAVEVSGADGPDRIDFSEGSGPYPGDKRPIRRIDGFSFSIPGTHFITVRDPDSGVAATSNAICVTADAPAERLFWGQPHIQTIFSDGLRGPEELYAFARDEAFLDICALSDHTEALTDRQWDYFTAVTNDFNDPGRFATLVGQEWTNKRFGHRNVYYPGDAGPILRANDPVYGELEKVYEIAREYGALVIPHHSANAGMGVDWSMGHDPEVERLVEVHSVWGNSERPAEQGNPLPIRNHGGEKAGQHVQDALALGRRYGFVGGGDIHDGRPGDELHSLQKEPEQYCNLRREGIVGVWAKELTREAVFDALWNRRCYATTNVRTVLRFSMNDQPMGSEIAAGGDLNVQVDVASDRPISRIELVADGNDVLSVEPGTREHLWECAAPVGHSCYYARVTLDDGNLAWSSPIWVV
jgi:uncharacterized protein DUF3604